jgi:hypothetical protein
MAGNDSLKSGAIAGKSCNGGLVPREPLASRAYLLHKLLVIGSFKELAYGGSQRFGGLVPEHHADLESIEQI